MDILKKIFILFLFTFPTGVIARVEFANGVAVSPNDIILLILIIYWVYIKFREKSFNRNYVLLRPILLFLSVGLISLILNFNNLYLNKFLVAFSYLVRFAGYSLLYFIVKDFDNAFKIRINKYLIVAGSIVVFIGFLQFFLYPSLKPLFKFGWDEHLYRMVSVFLDPNFAGAFFNIFLIYSLEYVRKNIKKFKLNKLILLSLIPLLSFVAIYLTYSRSALVMLFVSIITYLILINKKKFIVIVAILLFGFIFISPRAFQTEGTNLLRIASTSERLSSVQIALRVIQDNPMFGVGFNAYRYAQTKYGLYGAYWQVTHSGAGTDASFLFVLATTGATGFVIFIYFLFKIFQLAKNNLKTYGIILFVIMTGIIFDSLFINSLFYVFILEWIFIIAGLTESSLSIENS